jgi:exopolyphosphatase/guanosine-5'-triphosphate,3'-diphosphate pyrophosphatase
MILGGIDIGSNAVRLLVSRAMEEGRGWRFKEISFIRVPLRLGDDAFTVHRITPRKVRLLVETMMAFRQLMRVHGVERSMAVATSAMREAVNGEEIARQIRREAGLRVEIISGRREAELIYANRVAEEFGLHDACLHVEVGGGSTELNLFWRGRLRRSEAFNVGTIRILCGKTSRLVWESMRRWVRSHARPIEKLVGIGTGGNINKIFRLSQVKPGKPLLRSRLRKLHDDLAALSMDERMRRFDLNPDRADVIVPAAEVFLAVLDQARIRKLYVPTTQLVDGIVRVLYDDVRDGARRAR